jgi:UDP-N-acetylmuramoylalanine--D-glutamate ligase
MMTIDRYSVRSMADLCDRRVVVLGLARSGIAAARFLADAGAEVTVYDRRPAGELPDAIAALGTRNVHLALDADDDAAAALIASAELLVTSPSISADFPTTEPWLRKALRDAGARGTPIIGEVDLFLRLTVARVIGVTGTKGKTTTASLVAAMFAAAEMPFALGGNIGTPLIEQVESLSSEAWAVLELSELQLPTISRGADIAVYTNITADHLDRHGSVEAYRAVKARLGALTVGRRGAVVLNADDAGCRELAATLEGDVHWYGLDGPRLEASTSDGNVKLAGEPLLPIRDVALPGRHMLANVLAAALGASLAGVPHQAIAAAIRGFAGVPHRLETVGVVRGVRFVNDSQATIPEAAIAGVEAFGDLPVVLIAGGKDKGLAYDAFADAIAARAWAAVLIGETADELQELIGDRIPVERADDMKRAVERAADLAHPGDVVLLSPAAASFDMFVDYAARGDAFRAAVAALPGAGEAQ